MARLTIETQAGALGDIESVLTDAGFDVARSVEITREIVNSSRCVIRTERFGRQGINLSRLLSGLRQAGLAVRYSGSEPPST